MTQRMPSPRSSHGPTCFHTDTPPAAQIGGLFHLSFRTWFAAVWYVTNQKHGVSARGLQRVVGLGLMIRQRSAGAISSS